MKKFFSFLKLLWPHLTVLFTALTALLLYDQISLDRPFIDNDEMKMILVEKVLSWEIIIKNTGQIPATDVLITAEVLVNDREQFSNVETERKVLSAGETIKKTATISDEKIIKDFMDKKINLDTFIRVEYKNLQNPFLVRIAEWLFNFRKTYFYETTFRIVPKHQPFSLFDFVILQERAN